MARTATLIKYLFMSFVILTGGIVSTANAVNYIVPGPGPDTFPTIQAALNDPAVGSAPGDYITVKGNTVMNPTVYFEHDIDFNGKNVTVRTGNSTGLLIKLFRTFIIFFTIMSLLRLLRLLRKRLLSLRLLRLILLRLLRLSSSALRWLLL